VYAALLAAMPGETAGAIERAWEQQLAGRLVIEFEGGVIGESMSEVLDALREVPSGVESRAVGHEGATDICALFEREMRVPRVHCGGRLITAALKFSRSRGGASMIQPGQMLQLPVLEVEFFTFYRTFDLSNPDERDDSERLKANREWQKVIIGDKVNFGDQVLHLGPVVPDLPTEGLRSLQIRGIRWIVPIRSSDQFARFEELARSISGKNRFVAVERASRFRDIYIRKFTATPTEYFHRCLREAVSGESAAYEDYLVTDYDTGPASHCEGASPEGKPEVVIIDTPIAPHPDLAHAIQSDTKVGVSAAETAANAPASSTSSTSQCGKLGTFRKDENHGTYVAGIIGSRGAKSGFVGIAPDVVFRNIIHGENALDTELKSALDKIYDPLIPQVFVFTSTFGVRRFEDWEERDKRHLLTKEQGKWVFKLKDPMYRRELHELNGTLEDSDIFLVVSAGQEEDESASPAELERTTTISPQNMGDRRSVLVVTACRNCSATEEAAIWERAYFSSPAEQVVQLAAPGGDEVPGIISEEEIGTTKGGTSAAAAFTAGVAAKMLGCYPAAYGAKPWRIKERLLITARPNLRTEDMKKAAAGVLDPRLAMIDPRKTWLKRPGDKAIEEVTLVNWCSETLALKDSHGHHTRRMELANTRRIVRLDSDDLVGKELEPNSTNNRISPTLTVRGPGRVEGDTPLALIEQKDGKKCVLKANHVKDLVLHEARQPGTCDVDNVTVCSE
jgi:hypothetical protein